MWSYYIQYMVGQMPPSMPEERTHFFFHRKAPLEKSSGLGCSPFLFLLSTKRTCLCTTGSYLTWVISLAVLGTRRVLLYPVFAVDTNCTIVVLAFAFAILSCLSVCFSCSAWTLFRQPASFCYVLSCPALLLLASPPPLSSSRPVSSRTVKISKKHLFAAPRLRKHQPHVVTCSRGPRRRKKDGKRGGKNRSRFCRSPAFFFLS